MQDCLSYQKQRALVERDQNSDFVDRGVGEIGEVAVGDAFELGADDVGGETRGQQAAIKRSELALVELTAQVREPALEACTDERGFVSLDEDGFQGRFDVSVGDAAGAEIASDAVAPLTAQPSVVSGVLESVTPVVEVIQLAQARDDRRNQLFIFRAALEVLLHLVDRMRAAHQCALCGHVELMLGREFATVCTVGHKEI